jgi:hypothetical protein
MNLSLRECYWLLTTMEMFSPTMKSTTQLDRACHTDSRKVCGEMPIGMSM